MAKRSAPPSARARINWADPITRGLEFAWTSHGGGIEHVKGGLPEYLGTGHTFGPQGYTGSGTGSLGYSPLLYRTRGERLTFAAGFRFPASGDNNIFARMGGAPTYPLDFKFRVAFGLYFMETNGAPAVSISHGSPAAGTPIVLAGVYEPGRRVLYRDGLELAAETFTGGSNDTTASNARVSVGSADGTENAGPYSGQGIEWAYFWSRDLTPAEVARNRRDPWCIFAGVDESRWLGEVSAPQIIRPSSDVSAGLWLPSSGTDLFAMIDETPASDADYIYTLNAGAVCTIALQTATDPAVSAGHVVRYRLRGDGTSGVEVALMQNTTVIATWTHDPAPASFTDYAQTLSGAQADAITDYSQLRLRFTEV